MSDKAELRFGVDLVTFHHPGFWGVEDYAGIARRAAEDPLGFWTKILDAVAETGLEGIEMTFPPFDWQGAVAAFGSEAGLAEALSARGLRLCSGFFAELALGADLTDPAVEAGILASAARYGDFLAACGAEVMVAGLPMRQTPGETPARFFDFDAARALADLLNRLGALLAAKGLRLALHTEGHSVFAAARDVDLMLLLTDPAYVGLCPDTAHILLMGGDPVQLVERHHERVVIAHWKDATGPMPADTPIDDLIHDRHRPYFCGFGLGRVDWHAWMRLMRRRGIGGWAILELDAAPDPVGDLTRGLGFVRQALLPIPA
ncbi:sugar phosphate isomerase/epimerase [Pseudooceanicola sp. CBS1P-1]|uniref:TIM barrel protein n=1 Tax=Pseudooceanicola albus TaxID=2692189 RepID=A0A6L7G2G4_9RHOB|nr:MULTISPECIES: sugar phosphate isomerase/epimerase [Pseudooceanicola]MBT9385154.1 sugar phosphate isomerase/epimerase [Pseudooceanicola endophyticus]MXN18554.1 TIM barrel protein [Pseudooceanicola albus]